MGWYIDGEERTRAAAEISSAARVIRRSGLRNMYDQPITEEGDPKRPSKERLVGRPQKSLPRVQQRWRAPGWGQKEPRGRWPGWSRRHAR